MPNTNIDTLTVEIEASSDKASQQINKTTEALKKLQAQVNKQYQNPVKGLASGGDITKLSSDLRRVDSEIGRVMKALEKLRKAGNTEKAQTDSMFGNRIMESMRMYEGVLGKLQERKEAILRGMSEQPAPAARGKPTAEDLRGNDFKEIYLGKGGWARNGADFSLLTSALKNAKDYVQAFKAQLMSLDGKAFSAIAKGAQVAVNSLKLLAKGAQSVGKAITALPRAGFNKVFGGLVEKVKSAAKSFKQFIGSIGRIAMYRAIRSAIKAVTQAFQEGLKTAYEFSKGVAEISGQRFAAAMDSMSSAGLKMKNQLGSVFISLLTAIAPIVNAIISLVTRLADAIAQLFSAFTGNTYLRANDVAKDFADTMKSGGGAAKEWKNQLMGFDEINRLEEPNKGGGGGGSGLLDPASMFEDSPIKESIKKFVDDLKAALKAGDWKGAGELIGEKINELLPTKEKMREWGEKLGYLLNGAVSTLYYSLKTIDFVGIGARLAGFINGGLSQIDFETWGRTLMRRFTAAVDFLLGLFETLDWKRVGQAIGDFLRGAFYEGIEWLQSKDWNELGTELFNAVKNLIEGIDFGELAKAFFSLFGEAMKAQAQFSSNFFNAGFDIIKEYFRGKAEECGGDTWAGFKKGITDAIRGVVNWVKENIVDPFVNAIETTLGINGGGGGGGSPSTVFEGIGSNMVDGLFGGFSSAWSSFSSWVSGVFGELISWCRSAHAWIQDVLDGIGLVNRTPVGGHTGISGKFASGGFPEDGIFFANHGELVGKFSNGRTAVANNEQITAGIASAVYDAFTSAFAVTGGGNNDREVAIYLDGREIARTTTKYQNQFARAAG